MTWLSKVFLFLVVFSGVSNYAFSADNEKSLSTVVVDGIGKTANEAAQNAAENALKQVVGSFIDTESILEKQVAINGSIRTESKQITSQTREFSQGSIKTFEVIMVNQENGLFRVSARVVVRTEYFKSYVKKIALDEKNIDANLFAEIATSESQKENRAAVLFDTILMPLVEGEIVRFTIGRPISASSARESDETMKRVMRAFDWKWTKEDGQIQVYGQPLKVSFVVPVKVNIDDAFLKNSMQKLTTLKSKKTTGRLDSPQTGGNVCQNGPDYKSRIPSIALHSAEKVATIDCFYFSQLEVDCRISTEDLRESLQLALCNNTWEWMQKYQKLLPKLRVSLIGINGKKIIDEFVPTRPRSIHTGEVYFGKNIAVLGNELPIAAASFISPPIISTYERVIYIGASVNSEILKEVKSITVSLHLPDSEIAD
jgi:hypothetical protein